MIHFLLGVGLGVPWVALVADLVGAGVERLGERRRS